MDEKKIPEFLCEFFNGAGLITFMPEIWREDCGAIFMDGASFAKRFVDGSGEVSVKFNVAIRSEGYAAGDRLRVFETFASLAEYVSKKSAINGDAKILPLGGVKLYGIYSDGAEYRCAYEIRYVKESE